MKKHNHIEFLRFGFSIIVVYYHITHSNIMPYVGENEVYLLLQNASALSSAAVECFLIMSGYFLFTSWQRAPEKPFIEFAVNRFFRLWPVFALYTVCIILLGGNVSEDTLLDLAFLRCTGISLSYKGIIWYIAPFFWSSLLMYAILKSFNKQTSCLIIVLITYFAYVVNLNYTGGKLAREVIWSFLSLGMLRVLAGIGVGILIGLTMSEFSAVYKIGSSQRGRVCRCIFSVIEIFCFLALMLIMLTRKVQIHNVFTIILLFSVLFICFVSKAGVLSNLLDRPVFGSLGKYSYSIYVMQQVSFYILGRTFWQHTSFICNHEIITMLASVGFSVAVGVLAYYVVEYPVYSKFKNWEKNNRKKISMMDN